MTNRLHAFYFSGTGNTRYITLRLCEKLSRSYDTEIYDVSERRDFTQPLRSADRILLAFPVYGSSPPLPMRRFLYRYAREFDQSRVIIVATQVMFSGDGAASLGRTVEKFGGNVEFAEHFNMPNNLSDCKILAIKNGRELDRTVERAEKRMDRFVEKITSGKRFRRGFHPLSHATGYFCQRIFWRKSESEKKDKLKIDPQKCVGCGLCVKQCPVNNLALSGGKAAPKGNCVLCYGCVNRCPQKAISLLGKQPPEKQYRGVTDRRP